MTAWATGFGTVSKRRNRMSIGSMNGIRRSFCLQCVDLGHQFGAARLVAIGEFRFKLRDRLPPRPSQGDPPGQSEPHRAATLSGALTVLNISAIFGIAAGWRIWITTPGDLD
jgi:hypothetical protein